MEQRHLPPTATSSFRPAYDSQPRQRYQAHQVHQQQLRELWELRQGMALELAWKLAWKLAAILSRRNTCTSAPPCDCLESSGYLACSRSR
jgi:hypothetical protein